MQKIGVLTLLTLLFLPMLAKIALIGDYALRKSYYAAVLCENKAKPASCCEGRCQLKKQLKKIELPGKSTEEPRPFFSSYKFDNYIITTIKTDLSGCFTSSISIEPATTSGFDYAFFMPPSGLSAHPIPPENA